MEAFTYSCPTEVIFGRNTEKETSTYIRKNGGSRVLIVYGGGSILRSGLFAKVCKILEADGIVYEAFGGAKPNPTLKHARDGIAKALAFHADFILGIGGGSAIDTAKAIAIGAANPDTDIWEFWTKKKTVEQALPTGTILTIPAAGSETSTSSVLTNEDDGHKRGLNTDWNRPRFAIMNPELTFTLPAYQVACGVTDIMMHTLDRYFNPLENELTDAIAEALLRTVITKGAEAVKDPHRYDAMSELMWAGSLSHNGLTGLGGIRDFSAHQFGHELSAMFDTAHGASLSTIWGFWARHALPSKPSRFARYARNVWGLTGTDETELGLAGISATEQYFRSIGMPTCFSENADVGIQVEEVLRKLAHSCSNEGTRTIGSFCILDEEGMYQVLKAANI